MPRQSVIFKHFRASCVTLKVFCEKKSTLSVLLPEFVQIRRFVFVFVVGAMLFYWQICRCRGKNVILQLEQWDVVRACVR